LGFQNLPSVRAEHSMPLVPGRRHRWLLERERRKAVRAEQAAAAAADLVVAVTDEDADALGGAVVVPNGVDTAHYAPTPIPAAPRLLVTGTLNYLANVEGLTWFCDEVLPRVRRAVPDAVLDIVGRDAVDQVLALQQRPGIALHRDVPDVAPYLAKTRVAIVPVRIGTGTRLKALQAMAAGRPLVGTPIGVQGLGAVDGVHAHMTDDPERMAAAIVQLLRDDVAARQLAAAGRELVETRFDWRAIGRDFARHVVGQPVS
jgi:glycosyltransferase involved in cell wall biosynthesis